MKKLLLAIMIISMLTSYVYANALIKGVTYNKIVIKMKEPQSETLIKRSTKDFAHIAHDLKSSIKKMFHFNISTGISNFSGRKVLASKQLTKEEKALKRYLAIPLDLNTSAEEIKEALRKIESNPNVETVYAQPIPKPAEIDNTSLRNRLSTTEDLTYLQGYLNASDLGGIDAKYAWSIPGGKGDDIKIIDVENSWNTEHEDFPSMFVEFGTEYDGEDDHGTAVIGVMAAEKNSYGMTGIVTNASIGYSSDYSTGSQAIVRAADAVGEGGIVLIELHAYGDIDTATCTCNQEQCNYVAMEYFDDYFDAIKYATSKGVIVVEAAGNGGVNLDHPSYFDKFNRNVRDSGAILVAASHDDTRVPECYTNYGSRIDLHGWGRNVASLGFGDLFTGENKNQNYTQSFGGTSSAAPIVAGAVASLQGVYKNTYNKYLTPLRIRELLARTSTKQTSDFDKQIKGLPNLKLAIEEIALPKPSHLHAISITTHDATLTWSDNSTNERGFKIYRSGNSIPIATVSANVTRIVISGLTPNTSYTYAVKAYNNEGESAETNRTFRTNSVPASKSIITFPTNNAEVPAESNITLRWENNGATRNYLHMYVYHNGRKEKIFGGKVLGTEKLFRLPVGFSSAYAYIISYNKSSYLGLHRVNLYPEDISTPGQELYDNHCAVCHGDDGRDHALGRSQIVAGQSVADLEAKLKAYKAGTRDETGFGMLMRGQALGLDDASIRAVAEYMSGL